MKKTAAVDHPIQNLLAVRWSPYVFSDRPVADEDLRSLFEAARWAPSSYNEQPWRFMLGRRGQGDVHERILHCLAEPNQRWARKAPVLALGTVVNEFERNGKPNKAAQHDLGLAVGNLLIEATARGLHVHQMIGLDPEAARSAFAIPMHAEALTAIAIGYADPSGAGDPELAERDAKARERRPVADFVFGNRFGESAGL
ncbi:nitroreductase family protein [Salinisphaera hydrothermalis]|uniref:Nitroreductase n=1 Tax=Salinisphaera hydrothermalis (strain C41B8) TaxID=1304275 RepID=A0A084ILC0_SALHC|nr:nitroreductase family protein [Salinisphaera hydrothermalis]KEZ77504.1 nitroreductase [Salinisphaera hydrothermalis C41B8]